MSFLSSLHTLKLSQCTHTYGRTDGRTDLALYLLPIRRSSRMLKFTDIYMRLG